MKTSRNFYFLFAMLFGILAQAQNLKKDASIKDTIDGKTIMKLKAGESLYTFSPDISWYKMRKAVWVEKANFSESDSMLAAGTKLYNQYKEEIGELTTEVKALETGPPINRSLRKHILVIVEGYVSKYDIDRNSIPEEVLEKLLNKGKTNNRIGVLQEALDSLGFFQETLGEMTAYILLEKNRTLGPDDVFRIIIVVRGGSSVPLILTRDQPLNLNHIRESDEKHSGVRYYWFIKPMAGIKTEAEDVMYKYLPL